MPSSGRIIAIVLAVLLAAAATFAIYRYVDGLRDQAYEGAELVEVFVAQGIIPSGASAQAAIDQGFIQRSEVPRESRPDGAITALDQIQGLVALDRILPGDVIQRARFGDPATAAATGFEIPEDRQAISFQVGIPPGVAGFIRVGDRISVIAHIAVPEPGDQVIGPDGTLVPADDAALAEVRSQFLMQDIEVLAVGRRVVVEQEGQQQDQIQQTEAILLTVAVTGDQAEQLVFGQAEGSLYLTLLPEGFEPEETEGRTFENLFQ